VDIDSPHALEAIAEQAFRSLLWRVRARRLQLGVQLLLEKARQRIATGEAAETAFQQIYARAREQVIRQLVRGRESRRRAARGTSAAVANVRHAEQTRRLLEAAIPDTLASTTADPQPDFHCDAGLGGLARWLRAAGYDARFWPGIDDDHLLQHTIGTAAIMLTTDRRLMERGVIGMGIVPALLVPMTVGKNDQFLITAQQLQLPRRPTRCMSCGGSLQPVAKEQFRDRIPPRTYPWCDEYYQCQRCGRLLWRGTHWQHVEQVLAQSLPSER
jgi:uncharacterized protein